MAVILREVSWAGMGVGNANKDTAAMPRGARKCKLMRQDLLAGGEVTTGGGWCQGTPNRTAWGHVLISLISPAEGVIYASTPQSKRWLVNHSQRLFSP